MHSCNRETNQQGLANNPTLEQSNELMVAELDFLEGNAFEALVLVADVGNRERRDGDLSRLIQKGFDSNRRLQSIQTIPDEISAIQSTIPSI